MTAQMHLPTFYVKQKVALSTNRYQVLAGNPDGSTGRLMAVAQQKRMALKERVTFFEDESRSRAVFAFSARAVMDLGAGYDVSDEQGSPLGFFRKDFGASLLRSTFHLEGPGYAGSGSERSQLVAVVRRLTDLPFLPVHFDFTATDGRPLLSVERQATLRDTYTVHVPHEEVDFRVAACVAVALDALMQR